MKDQERTGLRRSIAAQVGAALAGLVVDTPDAFPSFGTTTVNIAEAVVQALEAREAEESEARAQAAARESAAKADAEAGAQKVEPL